MALPSMVRRFRIELSDSDRGVYDTLDWRAAQHPSETDTYLVARVLARALEHAEGVDFSRGLSADDEPAIWQKSLTGETTAWIEVSSPSVDRLHRASKTGASVAVYGWKQVERLAREARERDIHRVEAIRFRELDVALLQAIEKTLDRNNDWAVTVAGGTLYVTIGKQSLEGALRDV